MLRSNLKELLDSRRMTIRDFSRATGFRFESCRQMYHDTMTRFPGELIEQACKVLNVTPNDLFIIEEDANKSTSENQ
ncbi:helix-turn-helix domain-containing protein [Rossellomorea marisflavi]|uniref:helix-turn-helix domain-containing protein n=1 Tax=Rossellomorea marisflavi TaxID=189381 RepID=UPI0035A322A3